MAGPGMRTHLANHSIVIMKPVLCFGLLPGPAAPARDGALVVRVDVKNTGDRADDYTLES